MTGDTAVATWENHHGTLISALTAHASLICSARRLLVDPRTGSLHDADRRSSEEALALVVESWPLPAAEADFIEGLRERVGSQGAAGIYLSSDWGLAALASYGNWVRANLAGNSQQLDDLSRAVAHLSDLGRTFDAD